MFQNKLRGRSLLQSVPLPKNSPPDCFLNGSPLAEHLVWGISPSADGDQGSAFGNRKPLKRLDLNFIFVLSSEIQ